MHVRFEGVPAPGDGMSVLRVVIAEDHYLVPEGVRRVLEEEPDIEVVAVVGTATELETAAADLVRNVIVADLRMPPGN